MYHMVKSSLRIISCSKVLLLSLSFHAHAVGWIEDLYINLVFMSLHQPHYRLIYLIYCRCSVSLIVFFYGAPEWPLREKAYTKATVWHGIYYTVILSNCLSLLHFHSCDTTTTAVLDNACDSSPSACSVFQKCPRSVSLLLSYSVPQRIQTHKRH